MEQVRKFVWGFFESLGARVSWDGEVLRIENVSKKFEEYFGKVSPYEFVFDDFSSQHFAGKGSEALEKILRFLKKGGKTSILKIDFADVDAGEVLRKLNLKNCEVESVGRRFRNNFFTRFSFVVNFNYLNESERVVEEVFVYDGKVVNGDLDGYTALDDKGLEIDDRLKGVVKRDYEVALKGLGERLRGTQERIASELGEKMEEEVSRIRNYYEVQLKEFGGDLSGKLERIRELELEIRARGEQNGNHELTRIDTNNKEQDEEDVERLRDRLDRLRKGLVKVGNDDAVERVKREREATIEDAKQKFSLGVDRRLVNTTVVYYPVFVFKLVLKEGGARRLIDVCYDPLTGEIDGLKCESCGCRLDGVNLCGGGHLSCSDCMDVCGECGKRFCVKCLERSCSSCGRRLCKNCVKVCRGCGRTVCSTHLRKDCVSGEDRCMVCLRACLRCNGVSQEKYFGEARDGSKVCQKCLGAEKRGDVMKRVFER